jgi:hypothetical protein
MRRVREWPEFMLTLARTDPYDANAFDHHRNFTVLP